MEWQQTFGDALEDVAQAVIKTTDGGYALVGCTNSSGATGPYGSNYAEAWLVKTDVRGNMEWAQAFGGSKDDKAYSIIETSDGSFVFAGTTASYGLGGSDAWLVKLSLDTDGDGLPDSYEVEHRLDPLSEANSREDPDQDGLTTLDEYRQCTNPKVADSDGDGLLDGEEVVVYKTDPLVADSDGDMYSDGKEVDAGFDPNDPAEYPSLPLSTPPPLPPPTGTTEPPAFFIPGFGLVGGLFALACLVVLARMTTKR